MEAVVTKLYPRDAWVETCPDGVQIHGSYGFITEFELEWDLQDSIANILYLVLLEFNEILSPKSGTMTPEF